MGAAGLYGLGAILIYYFPGKFTFLPKKFDIRQSFSFETPFKEVYIDHIHGILFPANPKKGLILYFHGNQGNLQRWGKYAIDFTQLGYDFFAIDYPGYGKTQGKPSEEALYESANAAYQWAIEHYDPDQIVLYGRSLGSAPASYLSSKFHARMLILETPFYNFEDLYDKHLILSWYPIEPQDRFPVNEFINHSKHPVYIFHGTKDGIVPFSSAIRLRNLLSSKENFTIIPGGRHRNLNEFEAYHEGLKDILLE